MADFLADKTDNDQIKNSTAVLCRSPLAAVFALLGATEQTYLQTAVRLPDDDHDNPVTRLADYQERTEDPAKRSEFQDEGSRRVRPETPKYTLVEYARAAFAGAPAIEQQHIFGGMRQIAPHPEENAVLIPVEIRTLGAARKTWGEVQTNLNDLCTWAEQARVA